MRNRHASYSAIPFLLENILQEIDLSSKLHLFNVDCDPDGHVKHLNFIT